MIHRLALAPLLAFALTAPAGAQSMFFAGNGNGSDPVYRANLDGSNLTQVVTGLGGPQDIEVEPMDGKVYWTDSGKVQRANLDGTNVEDVVTGLTLPRGLAVDRTGGHVYWTSTISGSIERANLDGTGKTVVVSGLNGPIDVRVDRSGGQLYWIDVNAGQIQRSNLDGTGVATVAAIAGWSIEIDPANQRLFWATTSSIGVVNFDGTGQQTLVTGQNWADGLALDVAGGKIYWADRIADVIRRANLDGTNVETLVQNAGLDTILDVSLELPTGPCPAGWANYGQGVAGAGGVPALTAQNNPVIGQAIAINLGNGAAGAASGLLFLGLQPASVPGFWGGDLLVTPLITVGVSLPAGGTVLAGPIPNDPTLCGVSLYMQLLHADSGVPLGAASSAGLELRFGT